MALSVRELNVLHSSVYYFDTKPIVIGLFDGRKASEALAFGLVCYVSTMVKFGVPDASSYDECGTALGELPFHEVNDLRMHWSLG